MVDTLDNNSTPGFTIVELEQGSQEWLAWRHKGIGASEAPAIMGENPWKSADDLLQEKRGPIRDSVKNAAMTRGSLLEPEARRRYIAQTGKEVRPACLQSNQHVWLRASVDGISANGSTIVEIKCGESVYRHISQNGCIPDYYYGQLQHIMAVSGLTSLDFWCYLPDKPELFLQVARNDKYIDRLIAAEDDFWNFIQKSSTSKAKKRWGFVKVTNGPTSSQKKVELPTGGHFFSTQANTHGPIETHTSTDKPHPSRIKNKWMIALGAIFIFFAASVFLILEKLDPSGWFFLASGGYIIFRQVIFIKKK